MWLMKHVQLPLPFLYILLDGLVMGGPRLCLGGRSPSHYRTRGTKPGAIVIVEGLNLSKGVDQALRD